jgi:hypothetical protein
MYLPHGCALTAGPIARTPPQSPTAKAPKPSEFVYISEHKLLALAHLRGRSTAWYEQHITLQGNGRLSLPLVPGTAVSAQAVASVKRVQSDQYERAID